VSGLLGAWTLSGGPVESRLDRPARAAMRRRVPGGGVDLEEVARGRLWLVAPRGRVVLSDDACLAWEGVLALDPGEAPADLLARAGRRGEPPAPEGHFALAWATGGGDAGGGALTLVRAPSGGERLYFVRLGDLVLFAAALPPLLAHPAVTPALAPRPAGEALIVGHTVAGDESLLAGIDEVAPAHALTLTDRVGPQRWVAPWRAALRSPEGDPAALAAGFRDSLTRAVERAAGGRRPIAVALSGGIDSAAIAAAAVDVAGAGGVVAYSWEFDDPGHGRETSYAVACARALGIRDHRVFALDEDRFLADVPEQVWRAESPVHWPKAFLLQVARRIAVDGFDRYLTGFGVGSHMGYLDEVARVLGRLGPPEEALLWWRPARFRRVRWPGLGARLHPGLEPPHARLFHPLVLRLWDEGLVRDPRRFYPPELAPLLRRLEETRAALAGEVAALRPRPADPEARLRERLQLGAFRHLVSCIDVTRSEKASREAGILRISPAHFAGCLPYAYFPLHPRPPLLAPARRQRPGKRLLQLAYRGVLPDPVLFRKKSWADAVASRRWLQRGRSLMQRALPDFPASLEDLGPGTHRALHYWEPRSIQAAALSLAFFRRLFVDRPAAAAGAPPTWAELIPGIRWPGRPRPAARAPLPVRA